MHALIYPMRAARFRVLLGAEAPSARRLVPIAAAHVLAANVLPSSFGYEWTTLAYAQQRAGDTSIFAFIRGANSSTLWLSSTEMAKTMAGRPLK